ncbi:MAG: MoxR family ATPase [Pseudomonadota bacterium]
MAYSEQIDKVIDAATLLLASGQSIALIGDVGVGKTRLAQRIAGRLDPGALTLSGRPSLEEGHLIGRFCGYRRAVDIDRYVQSITKRQERVSLTWRDGPLVRAMVGGHLIIMDEFNRMPVALQALLLPVVEERALTLDRDDDTIQRIEAREGFAMIMTGNTADAGGLTPISDALADRLVTLAVPMPDDRALIEAIRAAGLDHQQATNLHRLILSRHETIGLAPPRSFRPFVTMARLVISLADHTKAGTPEALVNLIFTEAAAA